MAEKIAEKSLISPELGRKIKAEITEKDAFYMNLNAGNPIDEDYFLIANEFPDPKSLLDYQRDINSQKRKKVEPNNRPKKMSDGEMIDYLKELFNGLAEKMNGVVSAVGEGALIDGTPDELLNARQNIKSGLEGFEEIANKDDRT